MSREEVAALARAFSAHLVHLQEFRGLRYVGASAMPRPESEPEAESKHLADEHAVSEDHEQTAQTALATATQAETPAPIEPEPAVAASAPEPSPNPRPVVRADGAPVEPRRPAPTATPAHVPPRAQPAARAQQRPPARVHAPTPAPPAAPGGGTQLRSQASQWSAAKKLNYLRDKNVGDCRRCQLSRTRRQLVFGVGSPEADLMFVGEAPGAEEDRRGEPFVGAAGQRLDGWIRWLGLRRDQVYIANVLKCRPPRNRDPQPVEIERCSPFLHAQIRAIEPKVIVALGRFAGCLLLGQDRRMYEMRGKFQRYIEPKTRTEFPLVVTYHPSYVLRSEREPRGRPDRRASIKTEDQKVLDDLARAGSLLRRAAGQPR